MASALDITFPGNLAQVASVVLLRAVPSSTLLRGDAYIVGLVGLFNFDPSSLATDDGATVIKPNDLTVLQAGRWLLVGASAALASLAAPDGATKVGYGQGTLAESLTRTLRQMGGVDGFTTADQRNKIQAAFDNAAALAASLGRPVKLIADPDANYRRDGKLTLNGVSFDAQGATFTALSDGQQEFRIIGNNVRVANIISLGAGLDRSSDNSKNGFTFGADDVCSNFIAENLFSGSVDADGTRGHQTCGFYFGKAFNGRVNNCGLFASRADGFHVTDGSKDIRFQFPYARRCGDDSFATVSYRGQQSICERIVWVGGQSVDGGSRGVAVVGGRDVVAYAPTIVGSSAAAIYFAREASFDTYGTFNARALDFVARNCVTGRGLPAGFQNALVIMTGNDGSDNVDGASVDQSARDCVVTGEFQGVGAACSGLIGIESKYAVNPIIELRGRDAIGTTLAPYGIGLGGTNPAVKLTASNLGGIPIINSSGLTGVANVEVSGSAMRTQGQGPNTNFFAVAAPDLIELNIKTNIDNAPASFILNTGLNGTKIRRRNTRLNGVRLGVIDYIAAGITYEGTSYRMTLQPQAGFLTSPSIPLASGESVKVIMTDRHRVDAVVQISRSDVANGDNYLKLAEVWEYENTAGTGSSGADFIARPGGGVIQRRRDTFPANGVPGIRGISPANVAIGYENGFPTITITPAGAYSVEVGITLNTIYRSVS